MSKYVKENKNYMLWGEKQPYVAYCKSLWVSSGRDGVVGKLWTIHIRSLVEYELSFPIL